MPDGRRAGFDVHWRNMGKGPEPALMLHCALAHGGAWSPVAEHLGDRLSAVAPDMPGHGRSADWDGNGTMLDHVTAIAATFLDPGCHLIGHSFGAVVALRLAQAHGARIRSLTLIEPVLFAAAKDQDRAAFDRYLADSEPLARAFAAQDWAAAAQIFTADWGTGMAWSDLPEAQRQRLAGQMPIIQNTQPALVQDKAGLLRTGALEGLQLPVLMIRGAQSMPVIGLIHAALGARIPQVRDVVIAGAGHMVPLTHADAVASEIRALLDQA